MMHAPHNFGRHTDGGGRYELADDGEAEALRNTATREQDGRSAVRDLARVSSVRAAIGLERKRWPFPFCIT